MKKLIVSSILVLAAVAAFANTPDKGLAVYRVNGSETFKVVYKSEAKGTVKLTVFNANAERVFSETIANTKGFIRPLNFAGLSKGDYTIEVTDAGGKLVEKVSYTTHQPVSGDVAAIHISKLKGEKARFMVAINDEEVKEVAVTIYDANNTVLHQEVRPVTGKFAQVYTVKNATGNVTITVAPKGGRPVIGIF